MSFIIVVRRCASLLNSRPIQILPPSLPDKDKILSVSPSSLTGPSSSTWWALGAARHYSSQQALIHSHLSRFNSQWNTHYTNRLYSNSNMATHSALEENNIVLIMDLANNKQGYPSIFHCSSLTFHRAAETAVQLNFQYYLCDVRIDF